MVSEVRTYVWITSLNLKLNLVDNNLSENWRRWKQHFEIFFSHWAYLEGRKSVSHHISLCCRSRGLEIYNNFIWYNKDIEKIIEKLDAYCNLYKNITWETHVFNIRNQQIRETTNQHVTDLKTKVQTCDFENLKQPNLRLQCVQHQLWQNVSQATKRAWQKAVRRYM